MSTEPAKASGGPAPRPLSPHIQVYRWQLTSVMSILHRASGIALALGAMALVWWLLAAASGPIAFAHAQTILGSLPGRILLFGWTLSLFYHFANGLRHLWWDSGHGLDLPFVYRSGWVVIAFTLAGTLAAWTIGLAMRGG